MLSLRRSLIVSGAISLLVAGSLLMTSTTSFANATDAGTTAPVSTVPVAPVRVALSITTATPTCKTLPAAQVARVLGTSIAAPVAGWPNGPLNVMGKEVLIGGKPLTIRWLACHYAHKPNDPSSSGVDVSYVVEPTNTRASSIVKVMCSVMRSASSNFQAPKLGAGACLQGHSGTMQSSNGILAVNNLIITLFGPTSPSQTSALMGVLARLLAHVRFSTTTTMPQQQNSKGPVVKVTSTQYQLGNGMIPVRLSCARRKCSGVVQLKAATSSGTVILAQGKYNMPPSATMTFTIALTPAGHSFLTSTADNPIQATVFVTVGGGKSVSIAITIDTGGSPPTTAVTTTTTVTVTTLATG